MALGPLVREREGRWFRLGLAGDWSETSPELAGGHGRGGKGHWGVARALPHRVVLKGCHGEVLEHDGNEAAAAGASVNGEHGDETSRRSIARGEKVVELTRTR